MEQFGDLSLKIEYVPIDSLIPYNNNAKLHPDEQIEQIKESIRQFGFDDPIGVWRNNEIIEGHGRLLAAAQMGITEVPVIHLDHLTDSERKAYALAHNKLTMNSGFDIGILETELESIENIVDMSAFGFDLDGYSMDFLDFDGNGDGGGSMMAQGTKVRVVIGACMFDLEDPSHELYQITKGLNPGTAAKAVREKLLSGEIS